MRNFLLMFFLSLFYVGFCQQDPLITLYNYNQHWHNPAYCGVEGKNVFTLSGRNQWMSVGDNPRTIFFTYEKRIDTLRHSLGFVLTYDHIGFSNLKQGGLNYSFRIRFGEKSNLRFGTRVSVVILTEDFTQAITFPQDTIIPKEKLTDVKPDFDFGIWYNYSSFFIGTSVRHITRPRFVFKTIDLNMARHIYFTMGTTIKINANFQLVPSTFIRTDGVVSSIDINASSVLFQLIYAGVSFRGINTSVPFVAMGGVEIKKKFLLLLSYDIAGEPLFGQSIEASAKVRF